MHKQNVATRLLRRIYTSRLRMRFPHCLAFCKYLDCFIYAYGNERNYYEKTKQCEKRTRK